MRAMPQDERGNPQRRWEDVTRWDSMKDMAGVTEGFARHVDHTLGAHLVLAGPAVTGVADEPEAAEVYGDCLARWRRLPHALRSLRRSDRTAPPRSRGENPHRPKRA
ncbi:MAG: hypothetical protein ICV71_00725 [Thermoleophilia bacterium]|nr:hypothetical protein [Thermoleophilia bacterium]MDQ3858826.1 hypothetical protein [Actinomycetota bacterium]